MLCSVASIHVAVTWTVYPEAETCTCTIHSILIHFCGGGFFFVCFFFFLVLLLFFFFHPYPFQTHTDTILAGFNSTYLAKTCKFVRSEGVMVRAVNSPGQTGSLQILNRESPGLQIYVCNLQILRRIFWSPDIHL